MSKGLYKVEELVREHVFSTTGSIVPTIITQLGRCLGVGIAHRPTIDNLVIDLLRIHKDKSQAVLYCHYSVGFTNPKTIHFIWEACTSVEEDYTLDCQCRINESGIIPE